SLYLWLGQVYPGVDGHRVPAMDSGPLNVFHYAGYKDAFPVTNGINFNLFPL
ncbi:unnamed protein product, partial [marine sediment metagenome]